MCVEADAGWAPHWMYRADHAYKRHRNWLTSATLSKLPSEYFRENVYVTFQDDWVAFQITHLMNHEGPDVGERPSPQRRHVPGLPDGARRADRATSTADVRDDILSSTAPAHRSAVPTWAVKDGRIVAIGEDLEGDRIDATGRIVAPGSSTSTRTTTPRSSGTRDCRRRAGTVSPRWLRATAASRSRRHVPRSAG